MNVKKTVAALFATLLINTAIAQDLTSKHGEMILPQAKDWSIGFDATKFIKDINFDFVTSAQTISGKYFIDPGTAHRFGLRIGFNSWTSKAYVDDRVGITSSVVAYPSARATAENTWRKTSTAIGLSYGLEKRRGSTRLQGVYGAEAGFYLTSSRDKFNYGNKLNPLSTSAPVTVDSKGDAMSSPVFGKANNVDTVPSIQGVIGDARATDRKNGITFSIAMRAFVGAEFFVLPKLSIGGEFGWGFGYSMAGRSETTWESVGQAVVPNVTSPVSVNKTTVDGPQSSHFRLDTDNSNVFGGASATVRVNLYF